MHFFLGRKEKEKGEWLDGDTKLFFDEFKNNERAFVKIFRKGVEGKGVSIYFFRVEEGKKRASAFFLPLQQHYLTSQYVLWRERIKNRSLYPALAFFSFFPRNTNNTLMKKEKRYWNGEEEHDRMKR